MAAAENKGPLHAFPGQGLSDQGSSVNHGHLIIPLSLIYLFSIRKPHGADSYQLTAVSKSTSSKGFP
jgi:hypothetical protein